VGNPRKTVALEEILPVLLPADRVVEEVKEVEELDRLAPGLLEGEAHAPGLLHDALEFPDILVREAEVGIGHMARG
jgi:hypothetical protein